jgi:hypothetical protein
LVGGAIFLVAGAIFLVAGAIFLVAGAIRVRWNVLPGFDTPRQRLGVSRVAR